MDPLSFFSGHQLFFEVLIQKLFLFPEEVQDILPGCIPVAFLGQENHPDIGSQSLQGLEITLGLEGEGAGIVVGFAMHKEDGLFHLFRILKGRHGIVHLRNIPVVPGFTLEAKGGERAVIGPAAGNAAGKITGMGQQVGRHKGPVAVTSNPHPAAVDVTQPVNRIDGSLSVGNQLRNEGIVGFLIPFPYDGKGGIVEHRIAVNHIKNEGSVIRKCKIIGIQPVLSGAALILEFFGVRPDQQGKLLSALLVITGREI